jgi:hypothetical protein
MIRLLQAERVSQSEIRLRSLSVYGQKVFSQKKVSVWCIEFKDGSMALNGDPEKHRQTKNLTQWWKVCQCWKFDKEWSKNQSLWNYRVTSTARKHCPWNHLRFKLPWSVLFTRFQKYLLLSRWRIIIHGKHRYRIWNIGLWVHPRVKKIFWNKYNDVIWCCTIKFRLTYCSSIESILHALWHVTVPEILYFAT